MSTLKTVIVTAALLAGAASLALAQNNNGMPPESYKGPGAYQSYAPKDFQQGNTGANAAASGGSGTHITSQRTGSAENTQKVLRNQNGYRRIYAYRASARCRQLAQQGRPLPAVCR